MLKPSSNYRIIRIERQIKKYGFLKLKSFVDCKKITMTKFYAKNDKDAYAYLQEYKRLANKAYEYYYDICSHYVVVDKDGKRHEFDCLEDKWNYEDKQTTWYKTLFEKIMFELEYYFTDVPKHGWHWLRNNVYLFKNKHNYGEYWSIDCHILDDLKWNIPILNKHSHGISWQYLDKAVKEIHKDEKDFDINEWNKINHDYTDKEEKLAVKYQKESRNELLKYIKLYEFYRDTGVTDDIEFDKKWHHTLPVKKGTYDNFDYKKLDALQEKYWNKIWEWMRNNGNTLWD